MKLRNKKTGEIGRLYFDHQLIDPKTGTYAIVIQHRDKLGYEAFANYFTLAELNEDWEDYEPKEPLIKDDKIRKAVRAVADITGVSMMFYRYIGDAESVVLSDFNGQILKFKSEELPIKQGKSYTITELCGEEEE